MEQSVCLYLQYNYTQDEDGVNEIVDAECDAAITPITSPLLVVMKIGEQRQRKMKNEERNTGLKDKRSQNGRLS